MQLEKKRIKNHFVKISRNILVGAKHCKNTYLNASNRFVSTYFPVVERLLYLI